MASDRYVDAVLHYTAPMDGEPEYFLYEPDPGTVKNEPIVDARQMRIHDVRGRTGEFSLDRDGFAVIGIDTEVTAFSPVEEVRAGYQGRRTQNSPLNAEVVPFIEQMAEAYHQARIVVSRAGAGAVAEIVAARRASILIPIPGTSGDHQRRNARHVEQAGAALLLEQDALTGESLARALISLLDDPARLEAMEAATDTLYRGDAAGRIAEACLEMVREPVEGL